MSNKPNTRKHRPKDERLVWNRETALIAAKAQGCICKPDVHAKSKGGIPRLSVAHDDWCPMVDRGTQFVIRKLP